MKYISLKKYAKISLIPKAYNQESEANLSFKIGIEKRGIKLSPNKTKEILDKLNNTIAKWEKIVESLSNGVYAIIFDGIVEKELLNVCDKSNVQFLVGMDSKIKDSNSNIRILTSENF